MEKENVARIGVSLPPRLLEKFDSVIVGMGYANRSEAIRDAIREYILKNELKVEKGERVGAISLIYDHDIHGVNDVLTDLQHRYCEEIQSSIHLHLDKHNCMELIIVRGDAKMVKEIKDRLTSTSGVKHSDLLITGLVEY
jgi:CopG family nickel-responsive transcriptional regulator